MAVRLPKSSLSTHVKGQADHVDAWLMSYADMITLLFMFFVILVSVAMAQHQPIDALEHGEPPHPYTEGGFGMLGIKTPYEGAYRSVVGIITLENADQNIAVEKTVRSIGIDISTVQYFKPGTAELAEDAEPLIRKIAQSLHSSMASDDTIEVAAYTDDRPLYRSAYATNWELAAMRAARITNLLAEAGIPHQRLQSTSYADNKPLVPNRDIQGNPIEDNRYRNQRVVIRVQKLQPEEVANGIRSF